MVANSAGQMKQRPGGIEKDRFWRPVFVVCRHERRQSMKIAFLVLATFVAGAVTGAFFVMGSAKDEMRRNRDPRRFFSNTPDRWQSEMKLTPDQAQKIRPILQQIDDELTNLRALDLRETE